MVSYYRALRKRQYIMLLILYGKLVVAYIVILSDVVYDEIHYTNIFPLRPKATDVIEYQPDPVVCLLMLCCDFNSVS